MNDPSSAQLPVRLDPTLDATDIRDRFARDDRVRIDPFLDPAVARVLTDLCRTSVPFDTICHLDGRNHVIGADALAAMTPDQRQAFAARVLGQARRGVGFLYEGYRLGEKTETAALAPLFELFRFLNSPELLDVIMRISGRDDLVDADAQVTCYRPGHFLTRHLDDVRSEARKLAYVINLTDNWHPDWGGLLQFYADDGTPRDAWAPGPNVLSLFAVHHVHAVTYVAPYAAAPRLAVTGWFRGARD